MVPRDGVKNQRNQQSSMSLKCSSYLLELWIGNFVFDYLTLLQLLAVHFEISLFVCLEYNAEYSLLLFWLMKWDRAIMAPIIPQLIGCHIHAGQGFCRGKCLKVTLEKVGNLGGCREIDKHAVIKFCQSIHHKIQCTALCILEELKREKY